MPGFTYSSARRAASCFPRSLSAAAVMASPALVRLRASATPGVAQRRATGRSAKHIRKEIVARGVARGEAGRNVALPAGANEGKSLRPPAWPAAEPEFRLPTFAPLQDWSLERAVCAAFRSNAERPTRQRPSRELRLPRAPGALALHRAHSGGDAADDRTVRRPSAKVDPFRLGAPDQFC
jgi:hypothetical protein